LRQTATPFRQLGGLLQVIARKSVEPRWVGRIIGFLDILLNQEIKGSFPDIKQQAVLGVFGN
jgi:hypothetical protein